VFGLFPRYMPPLFSVLLRTTGAGFCYHIGCIAAAVASVVFGWPAPVAYLRPVLLAPGLLAFGAAIVAWWLSDERPTA